MGGAAGPLSGLHVVDLSTYVAGPSATAVLAQLGADVVRVDPLGGATDTRRLPLAPDGSSLYWSGLNQGKRSIEVDLRSEAGRDVVRTLLAVPGPGHGILVSNAVGQGWLAHEALLAHRPDLIQVHIAGRRDGRPAVDYTVNCEVGLPWLTGPVDSQLPVNHVLPAWDLLTGLHTALAVVAAVRERDSSGSGRIIELALADVAAVTMGQLGFVADVAVNGSARLRDGNYLYGSFGCDFATTDGRRVMVVALTERHWQHLVDLTGTREVVGALEGALHTDFGNEEARYRNRDVLSALLAPWFAARTHAEVVVALEQGQVLWGDYRTLEELVNAPDSPVRSGDLFAETEHPTGASFPVARSALRSRGWGERTPTVPVLGADTDDVLRDWLDLDDSKLAELHAAGALGSS
ncbi:CoA transferase [Pseudonocardia petroleophila]|uniref:CoA transferase n=1 Tax=Pseudonocardia petroleophila TaxID=37331 RepID=A0A7G7MCG9_9PSEU|nr:CoA transferase [Pseudonocardia petroleophila]QNG50480.1 CoA transferase [Pseudonocardia petroleophila]